MAPALLGGLAGRPVSKLAGTFTGSQHGGRRIRQRRTTGVEISRIGQVGCGFWLAPRGAIDIFRYRHTITTVARSSTTTDVFNAIGESHRREILDTLLAGEKPVGAIVDDLSMSQPQVSKHLRVLTEVGLVTCRAEGRRRLYRLEPARLRPFHEWLAKYEQAMNERLDRMNDYLQELQRQGEPQ